MTRFTGTNLAAEDSVLFLLKTGTEACGTTVRDPNIAQNAFKAVSPSLPTVSVDLVVQDLPTGNVFTICYCANFDSLKAGGECDAKEDFTAPAGTLDVAGAITLANTLNCVKNAP